MHTSRFFLVPTRRGQRYTQVPRRLYNRLIYKERPQLNALIKVFVNQIPKNLCITLTAARGNEKKPVGVEALAGKPAATTFNGAPTPTG